MPSLIADDAGLLVAHFGRWPSFHDAEVVSLTMDRRGPDGPWIEFVVAVAALTGRITDSGHFEQHKHARVRFRCGHVSDSDLHGFNHQNVLSSLHVEPRPPAEVRVVLRTSFGLCGEIVCHRIAVVEVTPTTDPD